MASGKLAYFFEAHDLGHVFADWPEEIGLVLCLDAAGICELLLFHGDERAEMPGKAAAVLGCDASELEVVPEVAGYATRRVLFTDEQKLMALILDEEDLAELAQDYLINYRFESSRKAAAPAPAPAPASAAVPDAEAEEAPRPRFRAKPKAAAFTEVFRWKPRLHLSDTEPPRPRDPKLPEGFITLDDAAECNFAEGVLEAGPNGCG